MIITSADNVSVITLCSGSVRIAFCPVSKHVIGIFLKRYILLSCCFCIAAAGSANTKSVGGVGYGQMVLELPKDEDNREVVISYFKSKGLSISEVDEA